MKTYIKLSILLVIMLFIGLVFTNFKLKNNYENGQLGMNNTYTLTSFEHIIAKGGQYGLLTITSAKNPTLTTNFEAKKVGINYHIDHQTLYIELPPYNEDLKVTVAVPTLKSIEVNNTNIRLTNLNSDSLKITQLGKSNIDWAFGFNNLKQATITASGNSTIHIGNNDSEHFVDNLSINLSNHARMFTDKITTDSLALNIKDEATISVGKSILKKINEVKNY